MYFLKRFQIFFFLVSCMSIVSIAACGHSIAPAAYSPPPVYWTPPDQSTQMALRSKDGIVTAVYAIPEEWQAVPADAADKVSLKGKYDHSSATCLLEEAAPGRPTLVQYNAAAMKVFGEAMAKTWKNVKTDVVHLPEQKTEGFVVVFSTTNEDPRIAANWSKYIGDDRHGAWLSCTVSGMDKDAQVLAGILEKFFKSFRYSPN